MNWIYETVEAMASFIEIYTLYRIYQCIFIKYRSIESRLPEMMLSLLGVIIIRVCNYAAVFSYILMFFFVFYISISAKFLYKIQYITLISIASFYFLCLSCFDFFILSLLSAIYGGMEALIELVSVPGTPRIAMIIGVKICWLIVFVIVKKYLKRFSEVTIKGKSVFMISVCGFFGVVFFIEQTFQAFNYKLTGVWLLLLVVCILLLYVFYFWTATKEEMMKSEFIEKRNKLLENNYESVSNLYETNAKLYHDLNNHLNVLYRLLEEGKSEDAKNYINEISKPISALEKTTWTGMDVVDIVINSKLQTMKENGIQADINVEFPANTGIMPNDMCTILANLLDNAIEAVEKTEGEKVVSLTIRRINHFIVIKVTNSFQETRSKLKWPLSTTKADKTMHGWGISSVRSTVEKYNGTFQYGVENNLFVVTIVLYFHKREKIDVQ